MEFKGNVIVYFRLKTLTGLHIGGAKDSFEIGGVDNPVIRVGKVKGKLVLESAFEEKKIELKPDQPYIPGSSLKGKIRSLLEIKYNDINVNPNDEKFGEPKFGNREICSLFGAPADKNFKEPVRIRVFDAYPVEEVETELKFENSINRITSRANPRSLERVPAGTEFEGKIVVRIFSKEDAELLKLLQEGMKLLEDDYLGGGGSRGSGRVSFERLKVSFRGKEYYEGKRKEEILSEGKVEALLKSVEKLKQILQ